jgi:cytochrome c553
MKGASSWLSSALQHPWRTTGILALALAAVGFIVMASGIVPLKASAGHWAITNWLLHFAMERSVVTHAIPIDAPPLDDPALIRRGASHYDLGCSPCHGNVQERTPRIPQAMLPPPPYLPARVSRWQPEELFYIVKHGVKFTGMPAWPAQQRDDEVWAVVAFLRRLPDLEPQEYVRLAGGDASELWELPDGSLDENAGPGVVRENCARCHGAAGGAQEREGAFPKLAGQRTEYMDQALRAYADGRRYSGIMGPIAANLTAESREQTVRHYASMKPTGSTHVGEEESLRRGQDIAVRGIASTDIPRCIECHGPAVSPAKNPSYPSLAGQHASYLKGQLQLMKERRRGGSEYVHLMHAFVDRLTEQQVDDVTGYFASLPVVPE